MMLPRKGREGVTPKGDFGCHREGPHLGKGSPQNVLLIRGFQKCICLCALREPKLQSQLSSGELLETGGIHNSGYWKIGGLWPAIFRGTP